MNRYMVLVGEWEAKLRSKPPVEYAPGARDQFAAASDEAGRLVVEHAFRVLDAGNGTCYAEHDGEKFRASAMVAAAFHLPGMTMCPHVGTIVQPLLALLPYRMVACCSCVGLEYPKRLGDAFCDWCSDEVPDQQYRMVTIQCDHFVAIGHACEICSSQILEAYTL